MFVIVLVVLALTLVTVAYLAGAHRRPITELDLELARVDEAIIAARGTFSVPEPRRPQQKELVKYA